MTVPRRASRALFVLLAACALLAGAAGLLLYTATGSGPDDFMVRGADLGLATALVGLLITWHRPRNRIGRMMLGAGLLFGLSLLATGLLRRSAALGGVPRAFEDTAFAWVWLMVPVQALWVLFLLTFPDGTFHRRAWRGFFVASTGLAVAVVVGEYLFAPAGRLPAALAFEAPAYLSGPLARGAGAPPAELGVALNRALLPLALLGLLDRFRTAGPVVRQQIKWLLASAALSVGFSFAAVPLRDAGAGGSSVAHLLGLLVGPLPAAATAVAVFKYRLWELDVVVSRALVYGLLWGAVSAVFLALAFAAGLLVGGPDARVLSALLAALLVTVAAQPARRRLERAVARLVYGERPGGYAVLSRLGETLQAAADVGELAPRVADAVRRGLGVPWAGVWLYVETDGAGALRPAAASGIQAGPSALVPRSLAALVKEPPRPRLTGGLPADLVAALRPLWSQEPAALAPLLAGEELVGLLACGQRAGEPVAAPDLELLAAVARESALALRTLRLEAELRLRLEQLEAQADELRRSRQRLVAAQDGERRRIERDLHDGVQLRLVTLAATLRRASRVTPREAHRLLEGLAGEAEDTVFALQELGRGIYPSVLADQGLVAALRNQAGRLPMAVRVEVEPSLVGRRSGRDVEAALYFVGLEAMANARKHAPGARLTLALRGERDGRALALEVHDDGPGFEVRGAALRGSGLQNMQDRVAAVGGAFSIESRPGAGTWLRAQVPLEAELLSLQEARVSLR